MNKLESFYYPSKPAIDCVLTAAIDNRFKELDCYRNTTLLVEEEKDRIFDGDRCSSAERRLCVQQLFDGLGCPSESLFPL